jgi:hypothetical protein
MTNEFNYKVFIEHSTLEREKRAFACPYTLNKSPILKKSSLLNTYDAFRQCSAKEIIETTELCAADLGRPRLD